MNDMPEDCPLTRSELRALRLLADGLTYQQVAHMLGRSPSTIRSQLHGAYHRLGVTTSYQAVLTCYRAGWLAREDDDPNHVILMRIEELFRRMVTAVERPLSDHEPEALSLAQRRYLVRLEEYLHVSDRGDLDRARSQMQHALLMLFSEAGVPMPTGQRPHHHLAPVLGACFEESAA